jgi:hypothetical protein
MKKLEYFVKEIEQHWPEWDKNGLPGHLYYLAFAKLGLDYYISTVRDSNVNADLGNRSIAMRIHEERP